MPLPLLSLENIALTFGGTPLLTGADLMVAEGERISLVGRNGSGKSTLMRIAAGLMEQDDGARVVASRATVRYLPQEPDFSGHATVMDYVLAGFPDLASADTHRAQSLLRDLGMTGEELPGHLSGGEGRRAALARVLAPAPDVLLLDEPTNHLDLPAIEWLESELAGLSSAIVLISHDRRFLQNLTRATVWLERGVTRRLDKGFGHFEAWRDEVFATEEAERHKQDRKILREIQWMHYGGVTARRARNEGRRRKMEAMRLEQRNRTQRVGTVRMAASEADPSGKMVVEAKGISKAYTEVPIIADLSIRVSRGDRLGIVGPNGAGKTTLIDLLTGTQAPDSGMLRLGASVEMVTLDQKRESLDPEMTLSEALTGGKGDHVEVAGQKKHVVSYMQDFLFTSEQARTPLRVLSGGERGRLMLARALAKPSNLLVLDEPTNDLDLETLDLLEDLLADYAGTVLLVSHDRDFLDRVVTSVLMAEGEGRWTEYAGGYSDMVAQRGEGVQRREAAAQAKAAKPAPASAAAEAPARKKKLGFKEQHALTTLPATMAGLEADIARQEAVMADPALYTRDPPLFARTSAAITKARETLAAAEEEWLRLEMLREELEG